MRSLLLLAYDPDAPSFRYRLRSLGPVLQGRGWRVREERMPRGRYLWRTIERRRLLGEADVVVLSKINLSSLEAALLARSSRRRVLDIDDAIYVRKPRRVGDAAHDSLWRRRKFAATCRRMNAVVVGSDVLAAAARPETARVEVLPTGLDVERYRPARPAPDQPPTVVWIGRPENLTYLEIVHPALARLRARHPGLRLRVVCSAFPDWPDVEVERVRWSPGSEVAALATAHVGIMPLTDDEWSRAKCAFKLLQYMAASLPCVASPVGANAQAVVHGETGLLTEDDGWEEALGDLLAFAERRRRFGSAGHSRVEQRYDIRTYAESYATLLEDLAADA